MQFPKSKANKQLMEGMWGTLRANYSSYLLSLGELKMNNAQVEGPRIGICASNAHLYMSEI